MHPSHGSYITANLTISLVDFSRLNISETLGPYVGDRIQRRDRSLANGLEVLANHRSNGFHICVAYLHECDRSDRMIRFLKVKGSTLRVPGKGEAEKMGFDLIAYIPWEEVVEL